MADALTATVVSDTDDTTGAVTKVICLQPGPGWRDIYAPRLRNRTQFWDGFGGYTDDWASNRPLLPPYPDRPFTADESRTLLHDLERAVRPGDGTGQYVFSLGASYPAGYYLTGDAASDSAQIIRDTILVRSCSGYDFDAETPVDPWYVDLLTQEGLLVPIPDAAVSALAPLYYVADTMSIASGSTARVLATQEPVAAPWTMRHGQRVMADRGSADDLTIWPYRGSGQGGYALVGPDLDLYLAPGVTVRSTGSLGRLEITDILSDAGVSQNYNVSASYGPGYRVSPHGAFAPTAKAYAVQTTTSGSVTPKYRIVVIYGNHATGARSGIIEADSGSLTQQDSATSGSTTYRRFTLADPEITLPAAPAGEWDTRWVIAVRPSSFDSSSEAWPAVQLHVPLPPVATVAEILRGPYDRVWLPLYQRWQGGD